MLLHGKQKIKRRLSQLLSLMWKILCFLLFCILESKVCALPTSESSFSSEMLQVQVERGSELDFSASQTTVVAYMLTICPLSCFVHLPVCLSVEKKQPSKPMHKDNAIVMTFYHKHSISKL